MPTRATMNCVVCRSKRQSSKSSSVQERAQLYLHNQCQTVVLFVQSKSLKIVWLNHGECMYMWAGQRVLHFLQALFKQGKLWLMLTWTWGDCKGSCNNYIYNWDSRAPSIALHASRNVAQRLKRLETIQVIEHCAVDNACKKGANSYCWSQVITVFIRRTTKSPYILYGTSLKFYPSPRMWRHHASRPLKQVPGVIVMYYVCNQGLPGWNTIWVGTLELWFKAFWLLSTQQFLVSSYIIGCY